MFAKIGYTWDLMKASLSILRQTPSLLMFQLLSGLSCLLVLASFLVPIVVTRSYRLPQSEDGTVPLETKVLYYGVLFLFYFANYFVITFFNTAIIAGAISRMAGGEPTVGGCLREAVSRIHLIAGWALLQATVGLILRIIEQQSEKVGRFVAGLLGSAWTILGFLVVPVLVVENKGPLAALKESTSLLRRTWGEQLVGNFAFGVIFFLLSLPAFALIAVGFFAFGGNTAVMISFVLAGFLYLIGLSLVQSALQSIFQAAVYMHTQGIHTPAFPVKVLKNAMYENND